MMFCRLVERFVYWISLKFDSFQLIKQIDKLVLLISYFDLYYGTTQAFIQSRKPSTSTSLLTLLLPLWSGNYSLTHVIQTHSTVLAVEYLLTVWEQGCTAIFSLSPQHTENLYQFFCYGERLFNQLILINKNFNNLPTY